MSELLDDAFEVLQEEYSKIANTGKATSYTLDRVSVDREPAERLRLYDDVLVDIVITQDCGQLQVRYDAGKDAEQKQAEKTVSILTNAGFTVF